MAGSLGSVFAMPTRTRTAPFHRRLAPASIAVIGVVAVALGACGGGADATLSVTTTKHTTTGAPRTSAPTTKAPMVKAPTTAAPTTKAPATTEAPAATEPPKEADDGKPPSVPEGQLTALVRGVTGDVVIIDRVEVFTGEAALDAFAEDTGHDLEGPEFYVRNTEAVAEELPLSGDAAFKVIKLSTCCEPTAVDKATFSTFLDGSNEDLFDPSPPFRLQAAYGNIVEITQLYVS